MKQIIPLQDLSGIYKCTINDQHDGIFTVTDVFSLDKQHSTDKVACYNITILDDQNKPSSYLGFAIFDGKSMAIYVGTKDVNSDDYSIVLAQITEQGFNTQYYQPTYKGGNTGSAECIKISN